MSDEQRHSIGGNFPPMIDEKQQEKWEARRDELIAAADHAIANFITTDKEQAVQVIELAKMCGVFCFLVEESRKKVKAPILEQGKLCDGQFGAITFDVQSRLNDLKDKIRLFMDWAGSDQVRTEHGAMASVRRDWVVEKVDKKKVNLQMLKDYISEECISEAALAYSREAKRYDRVKGVKFKKRSIIQIR